MIHPSYMQMQRTHPFVANLWNPKRRAKYAKIYLPVSFLSSYMLTLQSRKRVQRTETPDLLVNILDAMFIDASS
jgi:hypothetical protein